MKLSPSATRIRAIATEHFAEHGYDGASLSVIAEAAGMRKASLYSHFPGKDALYAAVLENASETEIDHATATYASDRGGDLAGHAYLAAIQDRYTSSAALRLLLRAAYAPPTALRDEVMNHHSRVLSHVRSLFRAGLTSLEEELADVLTHGYLGIVDSLHVEAVFGDARELERRRVALWSMLAHFAAR